MVGSACGPPNQPSSPSVISLRPDNHQQAIMALQRVLRPQAQTRLLRPTQAARTTQVYRPAAPTARVQSADVSAITQRVQQLEDSLQAMFRPGAVMPKASVVGKVRKEISTLKAQLAEMMRNGAAPAPANQAAFQPGNGYGQPDAVSVFKKAEAMLQGVVTAHTHQRSKQVWDPITQAEYDAEVSLLEAENERLRQQAAVLLTRQAQLEELALSKGIPIRPRSKPRART